MQKIHLKRTKRINDGHLWVFSNELYENPKKYASGSIVELYDMKDAFIGTGYINSQSLISVRILTRDSEPVDKEFFSKCIKDALMLRGKLLGARDAMRLIYSEGDFLPGLIADKYKNCLVLQFLTAGMEAMKESIINLFDEMLTPEVIILRNDGRSRTLEGLALHKEIVKGNLDTLPVINEDGILFEINPYEGQKTGFFLDQRENRIALKNLIKGGKGLDLFCYTGAWSIHLASAGAEVTGIDESEKAVAQAQKNAEINNLQDKAKFIKDDVFVFLKSESQKNEQGYDFIVLDPPAFVKSSSRIKEALKAYRGLNSICMRLMKKGGILATSSCSYHISREMFIDMLKVSARDSGRRIRLLSLRSQSPDHPILLSMPETEYLKCAFLLIE
ncbi:MAG: class I SAM-dependent rRNA methyltransferase [Thermodesulfovibrionales bacterium]|nr:class I SAM-dependent rRNA methyltransferase [Thermodesulfovibrionales bacterium]